MRMRHGIIRNAFLGCFVLLTGVLPLTAEENMIDFELSRIDAGEASVSPYWGYNAPKVVFDGEHFLTSGRRPQ